MSLLHYLDELWLSEPERCDRQDALRRQRQVTRRREKLRSKVIKQQVQCDPVPAFCESDVDSDDDSQPDYSRDRDGAFFESGGGDAANKDLWTDHLIQKKESSFLARASRTSRGSSRESR